MYPLIYLENLSYTWHSRVHVCPISPTVFKIMICSKVRIQLRHVNKGDRTLIKYLLLELRILDLLRNFAIKSQTGSSRCIYPLEGSSSSMKIYRYVVGTH